jgi:hypothetical protein
MASNPFYGGTGSSYGSPLGSLYGTPFVRDFLSPETPGAEFEAFLTNQGFGGFGRQDQFARSLSSRANAGFKAATLNNPFLTERDYLNQNLGSGFIDNIWAGLSPEQRGEHPSQFAPRTRTIGRA